MSEKTELSLEDSAAQTYSQLEPIWDRFCENANKKSLIRVVKAATKWPLQDYDLKFKNVGELHAFKTLLTILDCKNVMISSVFEEKLKKERTNEGEVPSENKENEIGTQSET